jgi:hypothetical protein
MSRANLIKHYQTMITVTYIKMIDLKRVEFMIGTDHIIRDCMDHVLKEMTIYIRNLKRAEKESY